MLDIGRSVLHFFARKKLYRQTYAVEYLHPVRAKMRCNFFFRPPSWKKKAWTLLKKFKACHWSIRVSFLETARGHWIFFDHVTLLPPFTLVMGVSMIPNIPKFFTLWLDLASGIHSWEWEFRGLQDRRQWKAESLKFPKIPAKLCLNGRLWTQFGRFYFWNFPGFLKKTISRGDLGLHRPEKFASKSWIRRGAILVFSTHLVRWNPRQRRELWTWRAH